MYICIYITYFYFFFDKVSNFRNILTNQKLELVTRNYKWKLYDHINLPWPNTFMQTKKIFSTLNRYKLIIGGGGASKAWEVEKIDKLRVHL